MHKGVAIAASLAIILVVGFVLAFIWSSSTDTPLLPSEAAQQARNTELGSNSGTTQSGATGTGNVIASNANDGSTSGGGGSGGGGGGSGGSSSGSSGSESGGNPEELMYTNQCFDENRSAVCDDTTHFVCGWYEPPEVTCNGGPCVTWFSNECKACANEQVKFWTEGDCPLHY